MKNINTVLKVLLNNALNTNFKGHDPFDGLNSRLFKASPFYAWSFSRLAWIQVFKRNPINLRTLFLVPKGFNPKAGALFILGLCQSNFDDEVIRKNANIILALLKRSRIGKGGSFSWGYNFPWQAKAFYVPVGTPNIVTSVFIGNALLELSAKFPDIEFSEWIEGIKNFILNEMVLSEDDRAMCFSYIPGEKAEVHNASLMTAAFLSRVSKSDTALIDKIRKAVLFSIRDIDERGFWPYGLKPHHRWMDNFHTGYNLEALLTIRENLGTKEYDQVIRRVWSYYKEVFFLKDGTPKYYHNKFYPLDIHTVAEVIIIMTKIAGCDDASLFTKEDQIKAAELAKANVDLALTQLWDKRGFFYYQKDKFCLNRISYLRWSQAWMFYALCLYSRSVMVNEQAEN